MHGHRQADGHANRGTRRAGGQPASAARLTPCTAALPQILRVRITSGIATTV